jgi:hypothetical protein
MGRVVISADPFTNTQLQELAKRDSVEELVFSFEGKEYSITPRSLNRRLKATPPPPNEKGLEMAELFAQTLRPANPKRYT